MATDELVTLFASPTIQLGLVGRAATSSANKAVAAVGLKPRALYVLALLHDHGPMSQQALGDELEVDPSILVTLLNRLESEGLASRERDVSDRRRHIVTITDPGIGRLLDGRRALAEVERELLANLDADERDQLAQLLLRIQPTAHSDGDACDPTDTDEC